MISTLRRKRRAIFRIAPLAFAGTNECAFLAADIGPGAQLDPDIKTNVFIKDIVTTDSGGDAVLTIGNGSGGALPAAAGFSITLSGEAGLTATDIDNMIASGNLVVDES